MSGLSPSLPAHAQLSEEELRRERLERMEELRRTEKAYDEYKHVRGWQFNFGSWVSTSFVSSDNDDRDATTQDALDHTWDHDLRFFGFARSGTGRTEVYARMGTQYTLNGKASPVIRKTDWVQPTFEMLYVKHNFGPKKFAQNLTFGRQYVEVDNSIALALVGDGLKYEIKTPKQEVEAFLVKQPGGDNNIDFLAPNPGRTKRWFFGSQYDWKFTRNHGLNFFGVLNQDANPESPDAAGQRHQIDSQYFGTTFYGTVFSRLKYKLQYIKGLGQTYSDSNPTNPSPDAKVDISSNAVYAGFQYYFGGSLGLMLNTEYFYGSGDGDAVGNVFSTDGGSGSLANSGAGGTDRRFISFGGKNLGLALAPTLTNLHVFKTGFSLKPFGGSNNRLWSGLRIYPLFYYYTRDKATGATSDPYMIRGTGASAKVGEEIDVEVTWRLMSDLKYTFKLGRFHPGPAYLTKSPETIVRLKLSVDL